jgi:isopenicillin-N epimerase
MPISRRQVLATAGWSVLAGASACTRPQPAAPARAEGSWDWVRAQFVLSPEYTHLSQFFIVSHPRPVREAIERYRRAIDDNPFLTVERSMFESAHESLPTRVQEAVADYVGGKPEDIALVDSTTMGLALVYHGLSLKRGQEVLTTTHDHFVHHESIRLATERTGASWRRARLYARPESVSVDEVTEGLRGAIRQNTRVVGLTWVHSSTGVKLPIRELAAVVADANRGRAERDQILLVVDGVHGFGNQDVDVARMGCDFFIAGTHKWIFAPRGTGIIWGRPEAWAKLKPTIPSFTALDNMQAWMDDRPPDGRITGATISPGGFKAYEHQWAMTEAFRFHRQIGRKRVADRIAELNDRCKEGLAAMAHVKLHTPRGRDLSAGIICFEVEGLRPQEVVQKLLARKVIASTSPYKVSYARLAPSLVNDEEDVERALRAVRELA